MGNFSQIWMSTQPWNICFTACLPSDSFTTLWMMTIVIVSLPPPLFYGN